MKIQNLKLISYSFLFLSGLLISVHSNISFAEERNSNLPTSSTELAPPVSATTSASPYTSPWLLRPIIPTTVIRLDSTTAFYNDKNNKSGNYAVAHTLTVGYKILPDLALSARIGTIYNNPLSPGLNGSSFVNPALGALYGLKLSENLRLGLFLGLTLPIGMGGGNYPDPAVQTANAAGILTRAAMDNALFVVNYFAIIPGASIAYLHNGFTLQLDATVLQLTRVRGAQIDKDSRRTNLTAGLSLGYQLLSNFSLCVETRYQRWLDNNTVHNSASPAIQNLSLAIGPRTLFKFNQITFKPGIAYSHGLIGAIAKSGFTSPTNSVKSIYLDLPFVF